MIVKKKAWPELFQDVLDGKKNFDVRLGDFSIGEGDILILEEWDPDKGEYTGRKIEKKVKYVLKTKELKFWDKEDIDKFGLQIVGFD